MLFLCSQLAVWLTFDLLLQLCYKLLGQQPVALCFEAALNFLVVLHNSPYILCGYIS